KRKMSQGILRDVGRVGKPRRRTGAGAAIVGVISDTHGLLRPEAAAALRGCDAIVHAGDVGKAQVLDELRAIAPLTVIRGNVDKWADDLPDSEVLALCGRHFYV